MVIDSGAGAPPSEIDTAAAVSITDGADGTTATGPLLILYRVASADGSVPSC